MLKLLLCLLTFVSCQANIPNTFHVFHFEPSNYSKEDANHLRSWKDCHLDWTFKIWTDSDSLAPPFSGAQICRLKNVPLLDGAKKNELRRAILEKEGGVWIHPDLICCKPIDALALSRDFFLVQNSNVICASEPHHPFLFKKESELPKGTILPDSFMIPDQIFATKFIPFPLKGVCFWKFKNHPMLNLELKKLQSTQQKSNKDNSVLLKTLSKLRWIAIFNFPLSLLNGCLLFFCCRWIYRKIILRRGSSIQTNLYSLFFSSNRRRSLCLLLILLLPIFSLIKYLDQIDSWKTTNFYAIGTPNEHQKLSMEDLNLLGFYNNLYSTSFPLLSKIEKDIRIPHVIHIIWGGENPFPETSIANIVSWIRYHPTWKFKFWTDDPSRPMPIEGMERHLFSDLLLGPIEKYLPLGENWGEKSDLLRYQILFQEGGVYVDHDIECFRSFDSLHSHFDFYASLEPLRQHPLKNSRVILTNCLIGAKPFHPILEATMQEVANRWNYYSTLFPDLDQRSSLLKTLGRTFDSFHFAFNRGSKDNTFIFPPSSVFPEWMSQEIVKQMKEQNLLFCNHQWSNSWFKELPEFSPSPFVIQIQEKIHSLYKIMKKAIKINLTLLSTLLLSWCARNLALNVPRHLPSIRKTT